MATPRKISTLGSISGIDEWERTDGPNTHLIKKERRVSVKIPVIKEVCSWVREENPDGAGSSLVKKCKTSIAWIVRTTTEVEYVDHGWSH